MLTPLIDRIAALPDWVLYLASCVVGIIVGCLLYGATP